MGKIELTNRENWQTDSGKLAERAECNFYDIFDQHFTNSDFILHKQPNHLKHLYSDVVLPQETLSKIFIPNIDISKQNWGVKPDFAIENRKSKKIIFGEIKRQDGWVEGKNPSAGRGNAHERLCKLFSPGLLKVYREKSQIYDNDFLPFWVVFEGDITRDPKRVREISFWFAQFEKNFFFWRDLFSKDEIILHFERYIKPKLL